MIKLVSDTIDKNDINKLIEWLSQDEIPKLTKGELTWQLERKWADKMGSKYSVFVNSGSSAILLALAALLYEHKLNGNKLKNNKIIVPALSWATDVSSPMLLGYETIMCDCNLDDLSCDLTHLEKLFKEHEPSVMILVSPLGLVPKMSDILSLCDKYDVILLEDVCESMGSKYQGRYLGTFGLASFFSLYFGHHLSTIEGGFINTDDEDFYHMLLMMRSHGWDRDLPEWRQIELRDKYNISDFNSLYKFYVPAFNLRSTDLQAYIGLSAIDKLDGVVEKRRNNFFEYVNNITVNELILTERSGDLISNFAVPVLSKNRTSMVRSLLENNIEVRPLIAGNIATHPMWGKNEFNLHNATKLNEYGFYIPNHQDITKDDIILISNILNNHD
jgi:CDP-4-dehydro-6-deoxyglucose reductase, E1